MANGSAGRPDTFMQTAQTSGSRATCGRGGPYVSTRSGAMSFDRRTVDQHLGGRTSCAGESMEEVCPDPLGSPSDKAVVERLARPIFGRRVDPSAARFQDMHDAADHPPVIDTRLAARVPGQIRLKPRKLRIREPETVSAHHQILHGLMNHNMLRRPIILWVRALGRCAAAARR